ncbi:hypothetical protein [Aeromicrobium sp. CTD01-1L150]|uniref:hypothetical protein n=1 Tax=Aeromicrobium sp. CTD01-1L150 TaxID=3341830 RepID=UPI0035BFEAAD
MPEDRRRTRLAAAVAASLVSLFVVVLGTASSQAATTRVGAVLTSPGPAQAAPVDVATSPDVDAVALDLAGVAPSADQQVPRSGAHVLTGSVHGIVVAPPVNPSDRGPPAR